MKLTLPSYRLPTADTSGVGDGIAATARALTGVCVLGRFHMYPFRQAPCQSTTPAAQARASRTHSKRSADRAYCDLGPADVKYADVDHATFAVIAVFVSARARRRVHQQSADGARSGRRVNHGSPFAKQSSCSHTRRERSCMLSAARPLGRHATSRSALAL